MLIYLETKAKDYPITGKILKKFPKANIIEIQHYKNIFDKTIGKFPLTPALILAKQENITILETPQNYGYPGKAFFFKTSINCFFDCQYCYLKGAFKNSFPVIFVNYEEIQTEIEKKIGLIRQENPEEPITFYASNYSDIQATDHITEFNQNFFPFFEQFENTLMETRTKSNNIQTLIDLGSQKKRNNIEISFSLNPQEIIEKYEKGTSSLPQRIASIQTLSTLGYKIGLRFLPLLAVENYQIIYETFLQEITKQLGNVNIHSIFIAPLIYTQADFFKIQQKNPDSPLRKTVEKQEDGLIKANDEVFGFFEKLFKKHFPQQKILRDFR